MKKTFFLFLMMLSIIFTVSLSRAVAADVPDFLDIAGDYANYGQHGSEKGYNFYNYDLDIDVDRNQNFALQYVKYLINNYPFVLVDNYSNDFRRYSAMFVETWVFRYNGSKNVAPFQSYNVSDIRNKYYCHLKVSRIQYFDEGRTSVGIQTAYALNYAEN